MTVTRKVSEEREKKAQLLIMYCTPVFSLLASNSLGLTVSYLLECPNYCDATGLEEAIACERCTILVHSVVNICSTEWAEPESVLFENQHVVSS